MPASPRARPIRLGVVGFLNTLPLIEGLQTLADLDLQHAVPSALIDMLVAGDVDLALCSSIDYLRADVALRIVPVGVLGCAGPTLTVRLYSTVPIADLTRVHCDTDSHTSVILMRILLREVYAVEPKLIDFDARAHLAGEEVTDEPEAMLLIGDKVVNDAPSAARFPHQLDLGAAWREHSGLPFVFAVWLAREDADPRRIATAAAVLDRQRRANRQRLDWIAHHRSASRKWPKDVAAQYLKERITYEFDDAHRAGMELFFEKARGLGGLR